MVFRDDECRLRTDHAPANFTTIKHIALNLMRKAPRKGFLAPQTKGRRMGRRLSGKPHNTIINSPDSPDSNPFPCHSASRVTSFLFLCDDISLGRNLLRHIHPWTCKARSAVFRRGSGRRLGSLWSHLGCWRPDWYAFGGRSNGEARIVGLSYLDGHCLRHSSFSRAPDVTEAFVPQSDAAIRRFVKPARRSDEPRGSRDEPH